MALVAIPYLLLGKLQIMTTSWIALGVLALTAAGLYALHPLGCEGSTAPDPLLSHTEATPLVDAVAADARDLVAELARLEVEGPGEIVRRPDQEGRAHVSATIDPSERVPATYTNVRAVLRTSRADGSETRRELTRSRDRLHVRLCNARAETRPREWLFVRNPVDPAQFTGWLVDHEIEHAIEYDWSSLIAGGIANSWFRLACLGVRPVDLEPLLETVENAPRREVFALTFVRLEPRTGLGPAGVSEIWWNAEHQLPLEIRGGPPGAEWVQELVELELAADSAVLADVRVRFPEYRIRDLTDYQDDAHVHAPAKHAHER